VLKIRAFLLGVKMKTQEIKHRKRITKICPFMIIDLVNNLPFCSANNLALCDKRCREKWQGTSKEHENGKNKK